MRNNYLCIFLMVSLVFHMEAEAKVGQTVASNYQKATSLDEILNQLQKKHEINIIYDPALTKELESEASSINSKGSIEVILNTLLDKHGLKLKLVGSNTYSILKGDSPLAIKVSGKVLSGEDNSPIPGVTVLVKGTEIGSITDFDGNYTVEVPSAESILIFSSIGFESQEIKVGSSTTIDVTLVPDIKQLSEVVITAIGLESDKRTLGYSINNVDSDDVLRSRETNIASALSSKAAGVQVITSSGSPGAAAAVRIRGNRTVNKSNGPLYVIDGVPVDNNTSGNGIIGVDVSNRAIDINPNDIEKITVLKGPSATVLYGSRAAGGAIMINTKRGKVGAPIVTLNSNYGISEVNKVPEKQYKYAQGSPSQGEWVYRGPETTESLSWGPLISDLEFDGDQDYLYDLNGRLVPVGQGNGIAAKAYDDYETFWVKGHTIDNNVSVNGGTNAARYYFSFGQLYQSGIVPKADFSRISIKSNIDASITEKLSVGVSATYVRSGGNRAMRGSNLSGVTTGVFRNPPTFDMGNGKTGRDAADYPGAYIFPNGDQRSYRGNGLYDNPLWSINRNPYTDDVQRVMGNVNANYKIFDWMNINYKLGMDHYTDRRDQAWDVNSASEPQGKVDQTSIFFNMINSDLLFLINKSFGDLGLEATIGHNYYAVNSLSRVSEGNIMSVQGFYNITNAQEVMTSQGYLDRSKFFGAFADVRFNFRDYLFVSLSGRNDWTSTLPQENNSFFYPATSVGLEVSELFGFSDSPVIPYVKLRASWGRVGDGALPFRTSSYYSNASIDGDGLLSANEFPAFGINAFERSGLLANNELIPELTTTIEFGGDFQFIDGRIGMDITYYKAFTDNQIVTTTISAATGFTSLTLNSGDLENKGIEITLNTAPVRSKNVSWDVDVTFTRNRSLVKTLPADVESISLAEFTAISSINLVGHPYGVFSGTRYRRNDEGQLIIGSDGWPLLSDTQGVIGDPNPDWFAGVKSLVSVYGVSFSMLWDIKQGGDVWNGTKAVMDYHGTSKESGDFRDVTGFVYDGVTLTGEANTIPVDFADPSKGLSGIKWRRAGTLLGVAEDNIEDASWIRLREVTIGYSLPRKWVDKWEAFQSVSLSAYGRNLLLFTEYKGVDPETNLRGPANAQGWDYFNLPSSRTYGVSLKAVLK